LPAIFWLDRRIRLSKTNTPDAAVKPQYASSASFFAVAETLPLCFLYTEQYWACLHEIQRQKEFFCSARAGNFIL